LKLHVSQPGISRQVRDLEDEIGFPLFERSAKSVRIRVTARQCREADNFLALIVGGQTDPCFADVAVQTVLLQMQLELI